MNIHNKIDSYHWMNILNILKSLNLLNIQKLSLAFESIWEYFVWCLNRRQRCHHRFCSHSLSCFWTRCRIIMNTFTSRGFFWQARTRNPQSSSSSLILRCWCMLSQVLNQKRDTTYLFVFSSVGMDNEFLFHPVYCNADKLLPRTNNSGYPPWYP